MHLLIKLPFPPSVNSLYTNQRGGKKRVKSTKYNQWCKFAKECLKKQNTTRFTGKTIVMIGLPKPDNRVRDAQNYMKAITDLLVDFGILQDDALIQFDSAYWLDQQGFEVIVDVFEVQDEKTSLYLVHAIRNLLLSPHLADSLAIFGNTFLEDQNTCN